ncbi:MAG: 6-carboxytetrahydropterin synthase QueD [Deltaproteobacteria bacterium]
MYEITILSHFSGAHRLRYLHGQCESLHGHNWKIEVSVTSRRLGKEGVALDFGILKKEVAKILNTLDHTFLNELPYFSKREPSSENIARYIFDQLQPETRKRAVTLKKVTAWESETASATYSRR